MKRYSDSKISNKVNNPDLKKNHNRLSQLTSGLPNKIHEAFSRTH